MIAKPARSASRTATIALVSRWRRFLRMRSRVQLQPSPCSMKSRDISAMLKRIGAGREADRSRGRVAAHGSFCDNRGRRSPRAPILAVAGCMPVQLPLHAPAHRPPRHGRVLRVGRAAALPRAARPPVVIGGGRRQPAAAARRRHARVLGAARLRRPRRRHHQHLRGARARRVLGDGDDEGGALAPDAVLLPVDFDEYRKYSRLFKAAVREIAPLVEDRGIDEIYIDLTDLPGVARRRRPRGRRGAQGRGARAHRPDLLDRHHAEQAAVEDRLRARQARRPDAARPRRHRRPHLAAGGAQGQRHRPEGGGQARRLRPAHDRRHRRAPTRRSWSSTSARATAPGCTRPRTAATSAPWSPRASRSRSAARPPSTATCTRCATGPSSARSSPSCASSWPATWRARATPAARIGIKLRFDDFKIATRDLTLPAHTLDAHARSAAPPASA